MAEGRAVSRSSEGSGTNTINRRRVRLFFQRFPGTNAQSGIQGLDFTIRIGAAPPITGQTPANGRMEFLLAVDETAQVEILGSTYEVRLLTGGLQPVTELRGAQQRLNMLGYNAGAIESPAVGIPATTTASGNNLTLATELAITNLQADHNPLFIDAIAGNRTQSKLRQIVSSAGGE